jgi:hypothetical protein
MVMEKGKRKEKEEGRRKRERKGQERKIMEGTGKERKNITKRSRIDCLIQQAYPFPNVIRLVFDILKNVTKPLLFCVAYTREPQTVL